MPPMHILLRGDTLQRLRIASGLVLFVFAGTHFLNHALGLIHVDAMHAMQHWRWVVTRSVPGTFLLVAALVTHIGLALYKLAARATLRLPAWELTQLGLGLFIPFLLFPHIVNTRGARIWFAVEDNYLYELARLWPDGALLQTTLLLVVWVHGCMGLHYWLRLTPGYRAAAPVLLFLAIAIPLASLGGFMVSGRSVALLIESPDRMAHVKQLTNWPNAAQNDMLAGYRSTARWVFAGVLMAVVAVVAWRWLTASAGPRVAIRYIGGPIINAPRGPTLLEISRMHGIPHASVCGGRARCSTCRVRVEAGSSNLPAPTFPEIMTLDSIAAPANVRLACQIRPQQALTVTRLLRPGQTGPQAAAVHEADAAGVEKLLAVMFLDLRSFTRLSQSRLPYDVVFILNEFFAAAGSAIHAQGGWIDKYLGDGLLAVFGQTHGVEVGCRQALRAARAVDLALDHVNAKLRAEIGRPLEVGIGIHAGPLLVGRIGFGETVDLTVVGNAVNVASRLEALSKDKGFQLVVSDDVARHAGSMESAGSRFTATVRGIDAPLEVVGFARGRDLPATILTADEEEHVSSVSVASSRA